MAVSSRKQIILELANNLVQFLPAKDRQYSFALASHQANLNYFDRHSDNLEHAIATLLASTLNFERDKFVSLIESIVSMSVDWRDRQGRPLEKAEVLAVLISLDALGLKSAKLTNQEFLSSLREASVRNISVKESQSAILEQKYIKLNDLSGAQRGYAFEKFLQELFKVFELDPRPSFRNIGEQIDGSITLDSETYLVEAKWRNGLTNFSELAAFSGKIAGKADWSRGIFISYTGFSDDSLTAFRQSGNKNLVLIDGFDIYEGLCGRPYFDDLLRKKVRRAAENGSFFVRARDVFS